MAELTGPIKFSGSIGDIRAYYNKTLKRWIVSTKRGPSKRMDENDPKYARQLENINEFKVCAKWASQLRKTLLSISHLFNGYYFSDIVAMGKSIQKQDDELLKGKRTIASSKVPRFLTTLTSTSSTFSTRC